MRSFPYKRLNLTDILPTSSSFLTPPSPSIRPPRPASIL